MISINQIEGDKVYPTQEEYNEQQISLIPSFDSSSIFAPSTDSVVFTVKLPDGTFLYRDTDLTSYTIRNVKNTINTNAIQNVVLYPLNDLEKAGYEIGEYNVYYNFYEPSLNSNLYTFFIKEISPSRKEIRISTNNNVSNEELQVLVNNLSSRIFEGPYLKDFYVNIGTSYYIANNVLLDTTTVPNTILLKLYQPLPSEIDVDTTLKVFLEKAETIGYNVSIPSLPIDLEKEKEYIQGPNFNIPLQGEVNNSTEEVDYNFLIQNTELTSSYDRLQNILNQKGIEVNIDYTSFNNFVHFSSAQQRAQNFYYKVGLIQSCSYSITELNNITGSNRNSVEVSASIQTLENNITNIIKNFDGYENYLYYNSSSLTYPKDNSLPPYNLSPTGSTKVLQWLGSNQENTLYYGGLLLSASLYDDENQNSLINSIPNYLAEDPDNDGYKLFLSMIGQHFDILYSYIKAISDRYDADNRLDFGISKDLVGDALKSMGINLYQNNFSSEGLYSGLIGINASGSLLPPTGSEFISTYITSSNEAIPLSNLNKEVYKRLYHNLPYLLKKKGTVEGLRALIACYGIPDTILRISEFGGKDKIPHNDWDYHQNVFSYYVTNTGSEDAYVEADWKVNPLWNSLNDVPETIAFRFKPSNIVPSGSERAIVATISGSTATSFLTLEYTGSGYSSGSYSGSIPSASNDYATLSYYNNPTSSALVQVNAPFYNGEWWSVMLSRTDIFGNAELYTLRTGCKIYNGNDGFKIGPTGSDTGDLFYMIQAYGESYYGTSIYGDDASEEAWFSGSKFYLPFNSSSGDIINSLTYYPLTGSWQELRYYNDYISQSTFDDYVMNPRSIEGTYPTSSEESLIFRASLDLLESVDDSYYILQENAFLIGLENESGYVLRETFSDSPLGFISVHPKVTGSYEYANDPYSFYFKDGYATSSFITIPFTGSIYGGATYGNPVDEYGNITQEVGNSVYQVHPGLRFEGETDFYYYDQPVIGIRNRISEKIRIVSHSLVEGDVLSPYRTIQQQYNTPRSNNYTKDINYSEIAFSPQNEINDDINSSFGHFNIGDYIGDPRQISSSATSYPNLDQLRNTYFLKYYTNYNWTDYVRLLKYFDNSLFKLIKDFTPARSSVSTGLVIKQHLLERNKYRPPQVNYSNHEYSASITSGFISGGAGGVFNVYNVLPPIFTGSFYGSAVYGVTDVYGISNLIEYNGYKQLCTKNIITPSGSLGYTTSTQDEFYNGELCGSNIIVTTGSLNCPLTKITNPTSSIFEFSKSGDTGVYILTSSLEFNPPANNGRTTKDKLIFYKPNNNEGITHIQIGSTTPLGLNLTSSLDLYRSGDILSIELETTNGNYPTQPELQNFDFEIAGISKNYDNGTGLDYYFIEVNNPKKVMEGAPIFVNDNGQYNTLSSLDITMNLVINTNNIQKIMCSAPLLNNTSNTRLSEKFMEIDYSLKAITPINFYPIVSNTAKRAPVQDYNYNTTLKNARYEGVRVSSPDFNINIENG